VVEARGQVFSFANWEGAVTGPIQPNQDTAETAVRLRLPQWLNDGKRIVAITDEGGEESFVILNAVGDADPVVLEDQDIGRPDRILVNPKKDQLVFSNNRYEIFFLDLEKRELKKLTRGFPFPLLDFRGLQTVPGLLIASAFLCSVQR
jgi:tricorn protease